MASDLLSLADASEQLGMSVERVRQLIVAGNVPGQRFGNVWVVSRDAIAARRHSPGVQGRPLGPVRAWEDIVAGRVVLQRAGRYQRRARVVRCEMSGSDAEALPRILGAVLGGARAAVEYGEPLAIDESVDLYLPRSAFDGLGELVAFVPDSVGRVALRLVDDDAWKLIPKGRLAPRAGVALDLLDSGDPRHWIAAEHLARNSG